MGRAACLTFALLLSCDGASPEQDAGASPEQDADQGCDALACGGDPVGKWTLTEVCVTSGPEPFGGDCEGVTIELLSVTTSGTHTFLADGTYLSEFGDASYLSETVIPAACLTSTCEEVSGQTCVSDGAGGCVCTSTYEQPGGSSEGTWSTEGTELTMAQGGEYPTIYPFCADNDQLSTEWGGSMYSVTNLYAPAP